MNAKCTSENSISPQPRDNRTFIIKLLWCFIMVDSLADLFLILHLSNWIVMPIRFAAIAIILATIWSNSKSFSFKKTIFNPTSDPVPSTGTKSAKGKIYSFHNGLQYKEIRDIIIKLRRIGRTYSYIVRLIKAEYPDDPEKWVSKSAMQRFWAAAKAGRFKQFGVDITVH